MKTGTQWSCDLSANAGNKGGENKWPTKEGLGAGMQEMNRIILPAV